MYSKWELCLHYDYHHLKSATLALGTTKSSFAKLCKIHFITMN